MYNFYQFDKVEKEEERRIRTSAHNPRKLVKYLQERDQLADRYNKRIVDFLEKVAHEPEHFSLPDQYTGGEDARRNRLMQMGRERFKFTTNSRDEERIKASIDANSYLDTQPLNISETKAWNLRPRSKDLEIGPDVRFKTKLQMERICDHLNSQMSPVFAHKTITSPVVRNQLKKFAKSGERFHQTFSSGGFFSTRASGGALGSSVYSTQSQRDSKLGNNVCIIKPTNVIAELHKKSHFKGATGFLIGQEASLEMKQSERLAEVFTSIAKNLKMKRESRDQNQNGPLVPGNALGQRRNLQVIQSAQNERSPQRGGKSPDQFNANVSQSGFSQTFKNATKGEADSPLTAAGASLNNTFGITKVLKPAHHKKTASVFNQTAADQQWLIHTIDEGQLGTADEQDPLHLTNNVLKMCKIIRQKHAKVMPVHRSSGRGGQGPYNIPGTFSGSATNRSPIFMNNTFILQSQSQQPGPLPLKASANFSAFSKKQSIASN